MLLAVMPRVSCSEWKSYTDRSGLFRISPTGGCEYKVYCDMCLESEQGWIIIQRRLNDSVAFENKNWEEYKRGFGNYLGNYWMGLEALHEITSSGTYHLYIGFRISSFTDPKYAYYSGFSIGNEGNSYTLSYSSYVQANSTASNDRLAGHKGKPFTTHDVDNDNVLDGNTAINCAEHSGHQFGGWWFGISNAYTVVKDNCYESNLNGKFYSTGSETAGNGIKWKNAGSTDSSMLATVMAIRRV